MPDAEIIDLTDSPLLPATSGSHVPPVEPLSVEPNAPSGEKRKKQRKRKRKQSSKAGPQGQDTTAPNTRSNSEDEAGEDDSPEDSRHVRRRRDSRNATKENKPTTSSLQEHLPTSKKLDQKEYAPSTTVPVATGNANPGDIFFEDLTPAIIPQSIGNPGPSTHGITNPPGQHADDAKLLLPAHVTVLGTTSVEILPPTESDEEGDTDYIKYLDYGADREREFLRYFEEPEDESQKLRRTVCKNCGAEGDHKTADCRVLICLTCGARDEHVTKSCPVSKVCFSCGMKGHIISNCPNRHVRSRDRESSSYCNRCYSEVHQTSECPTWWRLYVYVTEDDRERRLTNRRSKRDLELGKGGEGYIAEDEWCYNCGEVGHWGDDCKAAHRFDRPAEPSAFGVYNISTGPFYDPNEPGAKSKPKRRLREWERDDGAWNMHAPDGVGKQGRRKMMERMRKNQQKLEEESDADDWFGNARNVKNRGIPGSPSHSRLNRDRDRRRERDSKRDRERGSKRDKERDSKRDRERDNTRDRDRDRERQRNRDRDRDWERDRRKEQDKHRDGDLWERGSERDPRRDRDRCGEHDGEHRQRSESDQGENRDRSMSMGKMTISRSIGQGRDFRPPSLPARPFADVRPSLLERIGENPAEGWSSPSVHSSSRATGSGLSLSIKGAGRKQGRDNQDVSTGREWHPGPKYRGGYGGNTK